MPAARNRADLRPGADKSKEQTGKGDNDHAFGNRTIAPRLQVFWHSTIGSKRPLLKKRRKFLLLWACGAETNTAQISKVPLLLFVHKK
jgi:hypothetical protein